MATQIDSPDGHPHKDADRPSPDLVETDTASKEGLPGYGDSAGKQPAPAYEPQPEPQARSHWEP
ncbi:MAG: hypothetical protein EOO31_02580 [Comamonadaceae bacterium]|nr:MAG: hypothetical protein EOO31_02580 [Comamonadaceae bacterium]